MLKSKNKKDEEENNKENEIYTSFNKDNVLLKSELGQNEIFISYVGYIKILLRLLKRKKK